VESLAGGRFSGRVTAISPTADPQSRVFNVEVTLPNQDGRLRPGMIGTVVIGDVAGEAASRPVQPLTLPLSAVVRSPGDTEHYTVLIVERQGASEVARAHRVELGEVMGNGVAVVNGVARGDRVITAGATLLSDGDPVRVIP
jgi:multidrug efflux system membrane fusion protein